MSIIYSRVILSVYQAALSEYQIEQQLQKLRKIWQNKEFKLAKHIPDSFYKGRQLFILLFFSFFGLKVHGVVCLTKFDSGREILLSLIIRNNIDGNQYRIKFTLLSNNVRNSIVCS